MGVGVLAGGAVAGGIAVAAVVPVAAALTLGFGAYGASCALDQRKEMKRAALVRALRRRPVAYASADAPAALRAVRVVRTGRGAIRPRPRDAM